MKMGAEWLLIWAWHWALSQSSLLIQERARRGAFWGRLEVPARLRVRHLGRYLLVSAESCGISYLESRGKGLH